jgi:hypothetical protein
MLPRIQGAHTNHEQDAGDRHEHFWDARMRGHTPCQPSIFFAPV